MSLIYFSGKNISGKEAAWVTGSLEGKWGGMRELTPWKEEFYSGSRIIKQIKEQVKEEFTNIITTFFFLRSLV